MNILAAVTELCDFSVARLVSFNLIYLVVPTIPEGLVPSIPGGNGDDGDDDDDK